MMENLADENDCPAYRGLFNCCAIVQRFVNLEPKKMRLFARENKKIILAVESLLRNLNELQCMMPRVDRDIEPNNRPELFGDFIPPHPISVFRKEKCKPVLQTSTNKPPTSKTVVCGCRSRSGAANAAKSSALKYNKNYAKQFSNKSYNDIRKSIDEALQELSDGWDDLEENEDSAKSTVKQVSETKKPNHTGEVFGNLLSVDSPATLDPPKYSNEKEETKGTTGHESDYNKNIGSNSYGIQRNSVVLPSVRPKYSNLTKYEGTIGHGSDVTKLSKFNRNCSNGLPRRLVGPTWDQRLNQATRNQSQSGAAGAPVSSRNSKQFTSKSSKSLKEIVKKALEELESMQISDGSDDSNESIDSAETVKRVSEIKNPNLAAETSDASRSLGPPKDSYEEEKGAIDVSKLVTFTRNYSNGLPQYSNTPRWNREHLIEDEHSSDDYEIV